MITPLATVESIVEFLQKHLGEMRLPAPDDKELAIHFYKMALPQPDRQSMTPRQEDAEGNEIPRENPYPDDDEFVDGESGYTRREARELFPAIVIRPVKCSGDSDPGSLNDTLTVNLTVGVYEESNACFEGAEWVVIILERMRQLFQKYKVLDKKFRVEVPQTWELYDENVRPFWFGEMVTTWNIPRLYEEIPLDDDYRGANYPAGAPRYPSDERER